MTELEERVFLITGASGGLGPAVVRAFTAAGARVAAVGRSWKGAAEAPGVSYVEADLSRPEGARQAVEQALAAGGRLDGVVHLMGGFEGGRPVHETDDETWERMLRLNLDSAFYVFRAALPHVLASGGRILAIGSRPAVHPVPGLSAYAVSKAGLVALVKTIAAEGKSRGVTANVILPSVIDTPANRAADPNADHSRWVPPESIARLLVWLASESGGEINGAVIPVYGRA